MATEVVELRILGLWGHPGWCGWALSAVTIILIKRTQSGFSHTPRGEGRVKIEQNFEDASLKDWSNVVTSQEIVAASRSRENQGLGFSPAPAEGSLAPLTPQSAQWSWFQTSGLQNCMALALLVVCYSCRKKLMHQPASLLLHHQGQAQCPPHSRSLISMC